MKKLLTGFVLALVMVIFAQVCTPTVAVARGKASYRIGTPYRIRALQKAVYELHGRVGDLEERVDVLEDDVAFLEMILSGA